MIRTFSLREKKYQKELSAKFRLRQIFSLLAKIYVPLRSIINFLTLTNFNLYRRRNGLKLNTRMQNIKYKKENTPFLRSAFVFE